jgi:hypothetical protein
LCLEGNYQSVIKINNVSNRGLPTIRNCSVEIERKIFSLKVLQDTGSEITIINKSCLANNKVLITKRNQKLIKISGVEKFKICVIGEYTSKNNRK